jgi:hypothetical protein
MFSSLAVLFSLFPSRGLSLWGGQFHSGSAGFGKADCDRLLRRAGAMFPLAHVVDLFANKLACLGGWGFPLAGIFLGSLNSLALGHSQILLA